MSQFKKIGLKKRPNGKCMQSRTPIKKKETEPPEEQITESICEYLSFIANAQLNRITPSGFFTGGVMRKHKSDFVKRGISDIQLLTNGKFFAFEVKTPKELRYVNKHWDKIKRGPPSALNKKQFHIYEQIEYIEGVRRNGFVGEFVDSIEMVKGILLNGKR